MYVLQIYKDYPPVIGGIEQQLGLLAEGLVARGKRVTVLVSALGSRTLIYEQAGVRVIAAGRLVTTASTPLSPTLPLLLARERPDLIHLHHPYPPGDLALLMAGGRTPLVVTYHSDITRQRYLGRLVAPLIRRSLRQAARVIATSPAYIRSSPFLAPIASRCRVVPLGVPDSAFAPPDPARVAELRARYPGPRLLFVGRLRYYKGVDRLVRAMADLPGHAIVVGADASVRRTELVALAEAYHVAERVHFVGAQPEADLRAYYHAADMLILPSVERSEAFGIVQVEAQAAGLPVICTELGTGTSYVTLHERTGLVVPPNDVPALVHAVRTLIEQPELARALGSAGLARARAEFGLTRMLDRVETVYEEALQNA